MLALTNQELLVKITEDLIQKHNLAVESLTEQQLAEVIRQAIASGDFVRNIVVDSNSQAVVYEPYREVARLRERIEELEKALSIAEDELQYGEQ